MSADFKLLSNYMRQSEAGGIVSFTPESFAAVDRVRRQMNPGIELAPLTIVRYRMPMPPRIEPRRRCLEAGCDIATVNNRKRCPYHSQLHEDQLRYEREQKRRRTRRYEKRMKP